MTRVSTFVRLGLFGALLATVGASSALAGTLRERLAQRRAQAAQPAEPAVTLPAGVRVLRDVAYGGDPAQRFDVYLPRHPDHAPVIVMVHGGGWRRGDKGMASVVQHKLDRWVPRGIILVSVNYRLLPDAQPLEQAQDVALALALAQARAPGWGGDRDRFVLMGHSAGAHLVSLLAAEPSMAYRRGALPWLGTVSLDSAALDVVAIMRQRHLPLYDIAFGDDPAYWRAASPMQQLHAGGAPYLAVCSTRREDACPASRGFVDKARALHLRAQWQGEDLSHREIDVDLGLPGPYTDAVEAFLRTLDPLLGRRLAR